MKSWHPSKAVLRAAFERSPWRLHETETGIGGYLFERESYPTLYVFTWSNFDLAEMVGEARCRLIVRFIDAPPGVQGFSHRDSYRTWTFHFEPDEWETLMDEVLDKLARVKQNAPF